ncbi:hypothetical protein ACWDTI_16495 [Gordonia sp. NPDC003424]
MSTSATPTPLGLRAGDIVEVRSAAEIIATLNEQGELDNLPFMPEMLAFCGQQLTVHKVAHKLCDTISGTGLRKMESAVHLTGARCDGSAHGGCETACQFYWKEAWLKPARASASESTTSGNLDLTVISTNTHRTPGTNGEVRFRCQATELLRAAPTCLPSRQLSQYVTDVQTRNVRPFASLRALSVVLFNRVQDVSKRVLPEGMRFRHGLHWGFVEGGIVGKTPTAHLDLKPGELVRIKSKEEIVATLNQDLLNRGMGFEEEMARYCGSTARVKARVTKCIDERTGELLTMKSPCIVLDNVVCAGVYHGSCPREFIPFWREIWLERV